MLARLRASVGQRSAPPLHRAKTRAVDFAFEDLGVRSVADLGGVWGVDGGYTFDALERHEPARAVLVDDEFTPTVERRARAFGQLELIGGNFGQPDVAKRVGPVDAVLLFDVLLHQVAPDWDAVLSTYASHAWCFVIVNPQHLGSSGTVRLLELGRDRYEAAVPRGSYPVDLFDRLDEVHPERGRPWRDVHHIWQWGITDRDLRDRMNDLGFSLVYWANGGRWRRLPDFEDHAFVFARPDRAQEALVARGPVPGELDQRTDSGA